MYTIGQVSKAFNLPISTLRYYDKEGLFPDMERASGIRKFSDREIEALRVIECLKKSGLEIKQIKQFMQWCKEGSSTYPMRKALFEEQRRQVEEEIERLNKTLDMLKFKCWYYSEAIKEGNEDKLS
ncbi:MAG: MerR family transcriptional regulator, partial [Candidatus Coproplasma sp.]